MSLSHNRAREPRLFAEDTFGFHGFFNFHLAYGDFELLDLIDKRLGAFRGKLLTTWPAAALIVNLVMAGRDGAAAEVAQRCAGLLGLDASQVTLQEVVARCERGRPH